MQATVSGGDAFHLRTVLKPSHAQRCRLLTDLTQHAFYFRTYCCNLLCLFCQVLSPLLVKFSSWISCAACTHTPWGRKCNGVTGEVKLPTSNRYQFVSLRCDFVFRPCFAELYTHYILPNQQFKIQL